MHSRHHLFLFNNVFCVAVINIAYLYHTFWFQNELIRFLQCLLYFSLRICPRYTKIQFTPYVLQICIAVMLWLQSNWSILATCELVHRYVENFGSKNPNYVFW